MAKQKSESTGGIGICTVLFLIFLVLKLVGVITWSWWWVTAPIWIPLAVLAIILMVIGIGYVINKVKN